jgi:hypothetical protein
MPRRNPRGMLSSSSAFILPCSLPCACPGHVPRVRDGAMPRALESVFRNL